LVAASWRGTAKAGAWHYCKSRCMALLQKQVHGTTAKAGAWHC